jgi:hypothetical protein
MTDAVLQYGALGLLALVLFALGKWLTSAMKAIATRAEQFLVRLEESHVSLAENVAQVQRDSAAHYLTDSFEQRDIREALLKLIAHVSSEHVETRRIISALILRLEELAATREQTRLDERSQEAKRRAALEPKE